MLKKTGFGYVEEQTEKEERRKGTLTLRYPTYVGSTLHL